MRTRSFLIGLFTVMMTAMIVLVVSTSFKSNLFEVWQPLSQQPWFVTTMVDFYFNIAILSVWVIYKERNLWAAVSWIAGFVFLGSIVTLFYVIVQLLSLKKGEPVSRLLLRNSHE